MNAGELKKKYLEFFKKKGHKEIPNASLIPENDPTVLFTTAGMHPLVPFLLGQPHPLGKRLTNVQKCLRTDDIDEIGDDSHLTFFEMLGNWSLGDYFKEDAIKWSWEFLTSKEWLGIDKGRIFISVFAGDKDAPRDEESAKIWMSVGVPKERIYYLGKKDNWWGPAGTTGPCGPDTEMHYDTGKEPCGKDCRPGDGCGRFVEIWNDVFMQYNKTVEGKFEPLKQMNVDTGMGVERTAAALQGKKSVYETDIFKPIVDRIKEIALTDDDKSVKIIADHIKASTFVLAEGIEPSNIDQGYILRRLVRRAIRHGKLLGIDEEFLSGLAEIVIDIYKKDYPHLGKNRKFILDGLKEEETRFRKTLELGLRKFDQIASKERRISGKDAFLLFQSFGFPIEITKDIGVESGVEVDETGFEEEYRKHQELSRVGAEKKFKGGLSDASEETTKLHTATHMLGEALRRVLGRDVMQRGSNITPGRLRYDFNSDRKLTAEELKDVEDMVNEKIKEALPVEREEMTVEEAKKKGAQGMFEHKYGEKVSVYSVGDFSAEICGGPHVKNTRELGRLRIVKEESVAAGVRRIKAVME